MRRILWLVLLAVPVIVVLTLPARVVLTWFDVPEAVGQVQGTVWSGRAQWRQPGQTPLRMQWRWQGGRQWYWQASNAETDLAGLWQPGSGGGSLADVSGRLDIDRVDLDYWLLNARPRGYLEVALDHARLPRGQAPVIEGTVTWRDARLEGAVHESLGEIGLQLSHQSHQQSVLVQSMRPAPIQVRGRIELDAERYGVDLWLRASPDRPDLVSQLARLGEPQPDGQVRLELHGRLGW